MVIVLYERLHGLLFLSFVFFFVGLSQREHDALTAEQSQTSHITVRQQVKKSGEVGCGSAELIACHSR